MHGGILRIAGRACGAAALLVLAACGRAEDGAAAASSGGQSARAADTLHSQILYAGDELSRPQSIGVVDDWVLVGDVPRPHALHVISRTGRYLRSWGREGRGPGEFLHLWGIQPVGRGSEAWLYDPSQSRLTRVDVGALADRQDDVLRASVNLVGDVVPMTALWSGDSLVTSSGLFTNGRLARFDAFGRMRGVAGPLPPAPASVPPAVSQHAYSGTLVRHPSDGRLAILTRHADRVEIYTADGEALGVSRGPAGFEPVYEMQVRGGQPVMVSGDGLRFGYVEASAAGDHIYGLYSGFTRGQLPGRANFGGEVHVFDWDGNLHRILPLDRRALAIAVTPDERTLYTVVHAPEPAVLQYQLSAPGGRPR